MAETSTKLVYPTGDDLFQPHVDMKKLAESATTIVPVSNRAEADAIAAVYQPSPSKPLYVDRADTGVLERNRGNGWTIIGSDHAPFREAIGQVVIEISGSASASVPILFPPGRFTLTPRVFLTRASGGAAKYIPYSASHTPNGCNIGVFSGDGSVGTQTAVVNWHAIQMTPTSADG